MNQANAPAAPRVLQASIMVAVSACGFGAIPIFTLLAMHDGATLPALLIGRYSIAALALIPVAGGLRALRLPRASLWPLAAAGGIGQVLITAFGLSALRYLPAATVSFLFYTYPVWVTLLSAVSGADRLTPLRMGALVLSLAGVALMVGSPFSGDLNRLGVLLSLAGAISYAVYIPLINRLQAGIPPAVSSTWVSISAGILYTVGGFALGAVTAPHSVTGWSAIVGVALLSTVAAFILFLRGLAVLGPVRTAIISTVEPFFTAIAAALVLGQALVARTLLGGVLIVAAVTVLNIKPSTD
ncbi:MAG TPA: DMT family transporter [Longimicrobiales bacterium]